MIFPVLFVGLFLCTVQGSQIQEENDPARAEAAIKAAVKARGGDTYLNVKSVMTEGQYTPFAKGVSGDPQPFVDYIIYPDRERTEFGKGKNRYIQTNSGRGGWIYDPEQRMIRDQNEDQIKNFQQGIRHDLDNLLRVAWKESGAKLVFIGRREAWKNNFSEAVRIDFADGGSATLHFDMRSRLPMMVEYKRVTGETSSKEQVRYFRWVELNGVQYPTLQDFYRDDVQSARVSFDSVKFNTVIPEKLFEKPVDVKKLN